MALSQRHVLNIKDINSLRKITWKDIRDRPITTDEISHIFRLCRALWLHSGNPAHPHAELIGNMCSNGYIDVVRAISYTNICELLSFHLWAQLKLALGSLDVDWVIGSDHAAATFSHSVATWMRARHDFMVKIDGRQRWNRLTIEPNESVLQVEELVTTAGTLLDVRNGIREDNAHKPVNFLPVVGTLVHRSDIYELEESLIVYLVHYDIEIWSQHKCPLCAQGSERLRPKQNWDKLTAAV